MLAGQLVYQKTSWGVQGRVQDFKKSRVGKENRVILCDVFSRLYKIWGSPQKGSFRVSCSSPPPLLLSWNNPCRSSFLEKAAGGYIGCVLPACEVEHSL